MLPFVYILFKISTVLLSKFIFSIICYYELMVKRSVYNVLKLNVKDKHYRIYLMVVPTLSRDTANRLWDNLRILQLCKGITYKIENCTTPVIVLHEYTLINKQTNKPQ